MAENSELHKDKAFIKRAEAFQQAIDYADRLGLFIAPPSRDDPFTGSRVASKYFRELQKEAGKFPVILDTSKRNRAVRAFTNQTGPEFIEPIVNWYDQYYQRGNLDPSSALNQIYNRESSLRAPAKTGSGSGTEAHHQIALSTADRLRNMPIADQLQTFSLARDNGFPVGTYPEEMLMLSRWSHQGDPIGITAHTDPVRFMPGVDSSVNQGVWKSEPFPAGTSPQEAVARLADETFRPQAMMNSLAFNRQDEAQARDIMRQIAGGDLWTPDLKERAALAKNVEEAGKSGTVIDMNQYVRNPSITKPILESDLAKYLKIGKALPVVGGALGLVGALGDAASAATGASQAVNGRSKQQKGVGALNGLSGTLGLASIAAPPLMPAALATGAVAALAERRASQQTAKPKLYGSGKPARIIPYQPSPSKRGGVPNAASRPNTRPNANSKISDPMAAVYRGFNKIIANIVRD